jgi:hypothetical protein
MKDFFQFIKEARMSTAVQQAQRMGLTGDGHGGWYDKATGEFVAKTERGELVFYNKRQRIGTKDPAQTPQEKGLSSSSLEQQPQQEIPADQQQPQQEIPADQQQVSPEQVGPPPVEKTKGTLTIAFGRFNPPTIGHLQLLDTAASSSEDGDYVVVPSRTQDKKKNPFDADTKISLMRQFFPQHSERIVNDLNFKTIFDVLKKAHNDGYASIQIVAGADRVPEFERLANTYNGQLYQFDNINLISAGERDPDSEGIEGISASKMRMAAAKGDFFTFLEGLPDTVNRKQALQLFNDLRKAMNIKEEYEDWEIAPKFDWKNLRENYIAQKIFQIGTFVENLNTGLMGKIIRRGTNYLICVTEDNIMFKSWIKDVSEAYQEKQVDSIYREPGKPNTLTGTLGAFKYAAQQTPGAIGVGKQYLAQWQRAYGINFINKYKKSKTKKNSK